MVPMRLPLFLFAWLGLSPWLTGCQGSAGSATAMPPRDESVSFFGPGRERVDRRQLEPVLFSPGSWQVAASEQTKLARATDVLRSGRRAILAGFGDADLPDESSRMLGEARAQEVRRWLLAGGVPVPHLQTVAFGPEAAAWTDGESRPRVEFGLVR